MSSRLERAGSPQPPKHTRPNISREGSLNSPFLTSSHRWPASKQADRLSTSRSSSTRRRRCTTSSSPTKSASTGWVSHCRATRSSAARQTTAKPFTGPARRCRRCRSVARESRWLHRRRGSQEQLLAELCAPPDPRVRDCLADKVFPLFGDQEFAAFPDRCHRHLDALRDQTTSRRHRQRHRYMADAVVSAGEYLAAQRRTRPPSTA